jgi:hypothetical protein
MHFLMNLATCLVILSVMIVCWAMFRSKPDPMEKYDEFDESDIYDLHPYDRSKMKKVK